MSGSINSQAPTLYSYSSNYKVNAVNPVIANNRYYSVNDDLQNESSKKFDRIEISQKAKDYLKQTKCETCEDRKYKDISDDAGVSYKTPQNISPQQSFSAVSAHENEHVIRNNAEAESENKEVVSQSVRLKTDVCPECHKAYVSGGTTTTVTKTQSGSSSYGGTGKYLNCLA